MALSQDFGKHFLDVPALQKCNACVSVLCAEFFNYATPRLARLFFEAVLPSIGFVIADDQCIDGSGRGAAGR